MYDGCIFTVINIMIVVLFGFYRRSTIFDGLDTYIKSEKWIIKIKRTFIIILVTQLINHWMYKKLFYSYKIKIKNFKY